jgi:hypothetical protein
MKNWWTPDQTFIDLLRDREAIAAVLRSVAGDATADAHQSTTVNAQKKIIFDRVSGPRPPEAGGDHPQRNSTDCRGEQNYVL